MKSLVNAFQTKIIHRNHEKSLRVQEKRPSMKEAMEKHSLNWLLEPADPGVRYLALRDLAGANNKELAAAQKEAHLKGPIADILSQMQPQGFWEKPGAGYYPKYTGTVWSIILLGQLGASCSIDPRIKIACKYLLDNTLTSGGQFSINGSASGTVDCLQGNLCTAMLDLGYQDPRLETAFDWMARTATGEGIAPMTDKNAPVRFYASKCGPNFACGANNKLPCAWGAAKVMLAFSKLPQNKRTPTINKAIQQGIDFLFSTEPAEANYPSGYSSKPSGNWWKFGFPVFYVTDILQIAEALTGLGYSNDPRLHKTIELIKSKQDKQGHYLLEYDYSGKTWGAFGTKKKPNKWVTLRAQRVLKSCGKS